MNDPVGGGDDVDIQQARGLAQAIRDAEDRAVALAPICRAFVAGVYLAGLWDRLNESPARGMSGRFGGTHLRSWWVTYPVLKDGACVSPACRWTHSG